VSVRPRHVVCVLGKWKSFDDVERVIKDVGGKGFELDDEYSMLAADPRMKRAFEVSVDRVRPSFEKEDLDAVAKHKAVAYILSPHIAPTTGQDISARMLSVIGAVLEVGGTAVKGESSGIAHGRQRWLELAHGAQSSGLERASTLLEAWVRRPLEDEDRAVVYSYGMHLLGERDIELPSSFDPLDAVLWIDALGIYLVGEKPKDGVKAGETFRPTKQDDRRVLRELPCERYEEDDFFFNPYGYWNLTETR